jgi:hypothetical protein
MLNCLGQYLAPTSNYYVYWQYPREVLVYVTSEYASSLSMIYIGTLLDPP